ncbi:MAG: hypothetical protein P8H17_04520 [Flavobacteriales bacterium]|nr:hypothetical protein [Flavobacteriales bacterium]
MKKLLFVLAFAFIGQQAMSQIYIVTTNYYSVGGCSNASPYYITLSKTDPAGNTTNICIPKTNSGISTFTQELNSIVNLGYNLIETSYAQGSMISTGGTNYILEGSTFIFAKP